MVRRTTRRKPRMTKPKRNTRRKARLTAPVARTINTMINRQRETKEASCGSFSASPWGNSGSYGITFNSGIFNTTEFYPLIPPTVQGFAEQERNGNKIYPSGLTLRVLLSARGDYQSSFLGRVRLFVVSQKSVKSINLQSLLEPDLLLEQSGQTSPYNGTPFAHITPVNKDYFNVYHDKRLTVSKGTGQGPILSNGYEGTQVFVSNQQAYEMVMRIKLPKTLFYSDNDQTVPANSAIWFAVGYVQPDGQTTPDNINQRIICNWISTMYYKDA